MKAGKHIPQLQQEPHAPWWEAGTLHLQLRHIPNLSLSKTEFNQNGQTVLEIGICADATWAPVKIQGAQNQLFYSFECHIPQQPTDKGRSMNHHQKKPNYPLGFSLL